MEMSETSSDSWENESTSTPQTVFESQNIYITHEKAKNNGLPFKLKKYSRRKTLNRTNSVEVDDSDIDAETTTSYPSKIDSYSTINDFSSSISSLLSCTNECDHTKSFRDTFPIVEKRNKQIIGNQLQNICSDKNPLQNYEKCLLKRQNPHSQISILNKNLENDDIKENTVRKNNGKKHLAGNSTSHSILKDLAGQHTEQIASRFGPVINIFKKPGHHKGPTKNPDCCCVHCKRYFLCN